MQYDRINIFGAFLTFILVIFAQAVLTGVIMFLWNGVAKFYNFQEISYFGALGLLFVISLVIGMFIGGKTKREIGPSQSGKIDLQDFQGQNR